MDSQRTGHDAGQITSPSLGADRVLTETPAGHLGVAHGPASAVGENVMTVRNRVQWGPIMAGLLTTIASMLVLTVLGLAIGTSAFEPRDSGQTIGTSAAIWGAISALISFFLGGWVAAKSAATAGGFSGLMQGLMVGATALALILYLTGSGLGNLFGTIGSNIGDIANVAQDTAQTEGVTTGEAQDQATQAVDGAQAQAGEVVDDVKQGFLDAEEGAWGTLGGLILALAAAGIGGLLGQNKRSDLVRGTG